MTTNNEMRIAKIQTTKIYKKIIIIFFIFTVILISAIAYFSFSKTKILITLNPKTVSTNFSLTMKKEITNEENTDNTIIMGQLLSTTQKGSKTFQNTNQGGEQIEAQASGQVTIYNNWTEDQPLAATTRLLSPDGILFRIKNRVDVPAHGQVDNVEVYADVAGASGNIEPTKFSIPGLWSGLQDKIYAESFEPMTGGLRQANIITQANIAQSKSELIDQLVDQAISELNESEEVQTTKCQLKNESAKTIILEERSSVEPNQEAASFTLDLHIRVIIPCLEINELKTKVENQLKLELSDDEQLISLSPENFSYSLADFNLEAQTATLNIKASGESKPRLSNPIFDRSRITGKDLQEIKMYYSNFDEIKNVIVKFSPFWIQKAPSLKDHIEILLQN